MLDGVVSKSVLFRFFVPKYVSVVVEAAVWVGARRETRGEAFFNVRSFLISLRQKKK